MENLLYKENSYIITVPMNTDNYEDIVRENIYSIIHDKKLVQAHIAEKLGMKPQQLNAALKGKKPIKNLINEIAKVMEVTVTDILCYSHISPQGITWQKLFDRLMDAGNFEQAVRVVESLLPPQTATK